MKGGTGVARTMDDTVLGERSWNDKRCKYMVTGSCGYVYTYVHYLLRVCHPTDCCIESGVGHYKGGVATKKNTDYVINIAGGGGEFSLTGGH